MEAGADPLSLGASGFCFRAGGSINLLLSSSFLVVWLGLLLLFLILWLDHRERDEAGRFKGLVFDAYQRRFLKAYFSRGRGLAHGLVMLACLITFAVTMIVAMTVYEIRWQPCRPLPASQLEVR